jgi:hypothetical protein
MGNNLNRFIETIPKALNPETNRVMHALLYAIALSDDDIETSIQDAKDQLFVKTATGKYLDKLANSFGVTRPQSLGMTDNEFRELIPNLSLKPKTLKKSFYETADVFWGPLYSRANITSQNFAPFNVSLGDELLISVNNGLLQQIKVLTGDIAANGLATAEELQVILSRVKGATAIVQADPISGNNAINIRTNTPGSTGSIEIYASSMIGTSKLDFKIGAFDILSLEQRVVVYSVNANELLIEIPAVIPALRRTLRGSHHFHADATIEPARGIAQGIWQGSFLFNPNSQTNSFTVSKEHCTNQQIITKGNIYTSIAVSNNSEFTANTGKLMIDFGRNTQEGPIKYRGLPNSNSILIDPAYIFKNTHTVGANINVISDIRPYTPLKNGKDLAVYLTSPAGARSVVQGILTGLAAAGIIVSFKVLAPTYKYIVSNPYVD